VKGPVAPAVVAVTAIALVLWDRDARWLKRLKPLTGVAIALAVAAPWLIAIGLKSHGEFFRASLGTDFGAKIAGGRESHGAPPGYYAALVTLSFFPGTLFLLPALRDAVSRVREPQIRFLLAWAAGVWLTFELVPTKLPHYILPAYPALALLCALWLWRDEERRGWTVASMVEFAIGLIAFVLALMLLPSRFDSGTSGLAWTMLAAATAAGVVAVFAVLRKAQGRAVTAALVAVFALYATVAIEAPALTTLWVSPRLEDVVTANSRRSDPSPVAAGFTEPSLVFLIGTSTRLANGPSQAAVEAQSGGLALVDDSVRPAFLARLGALGASARDVGEVSGLNYSRGRSVHVTVYRVTPRR
jgi:4-amino-4-deoxy-L-arabinose transferase-like glycosyltransferase